MWGTVRSRWPKKNVAGLSVIDYFSHLSDTTGRGIIGNGTIYLKLVHESGTKDPVIIQRDIEYVSYCNVDKYSTKYDTNNKTSEKQLY
jgi:hypothetical protein